MSRAMAIVAALLVAVAAFVSYTRPQPGDLPVQGEVPAFRLVESSGQPFDSAALSGRAWVADFIFTQCPGICPMMSAQMQRVQSALEVRGDVSTWLVSITVDPKNDSPEVLRDYGRKFGARPERWKFLTGPRQALHDLIGKGFNLSVAERDEDPDGQGLITHSDRFVLVDGDGRIRGYYSGTEASEVDRLVADLDKIAR